MKLSLNHLLNEAEDAAVAVLAAVYIGGFVFAVLAATQRLTMG